ASARPTATRTVTSEKRTRRPGDVAPAAVTWRACSEGDVAGAGTATETYRPRASTSKDPPTSEGPRCGDDPPGRKMDRLARRRDAARRVGVSPRDPGAWRGPTGR